MKCYHAVRTAEKVQTICERATILRYTHIASPSRLVLFPSAGSP